MNQHTKPCRTCPFSKTCPPGELGGSPPGKFIGQVYGAFWLPCHERVDCSNPNWKTEYEVSQCAGAAIVRGMWFPAKRPDELLKLPASDTVFASPAEFLSHHTGIGMGTSAAWLDDVPPVVLWMHEMKRAGTQVISGQLNNNQTKTG